MTSTEWYDLAGIVGVGIVAVLAWFVIKRKYR